MARLRARDGCPWDRAQDYDSVKGLLLEEAYEVVDAVSARDFDALEDELGDLLFQVVFYSRLAEEENRFNIDGVVDRVHDKLTRRHPHVFGDVVARTPEEALRSWNAVKESERRARGTGPDQIGAGVLPVRGDGQGAPSTPEEQGRGAHATSLLDGMPAALPATLEANEMGVRVAEVGFDWAKVEDLLDKVEEEVHELRREVAGQSSGGSSQTAEKEDGRRVEEEVGDLMFSVANLARYVHSDPESCLRRANQKFRRRFQALEQEVQNRGKKVRECSPEELDSVWTTVKMREGR